MLLRPFNRKFLWVLLNNSLNVRHILLVPAVRLLDTLLWVGLPHGNLRVQRTQRLILEQRRRRAASNPGFPDSEGLIRFIVRVPSCPNSPRESWTDFSERSCFVAAFHLACGERSEACRPPFWLRPQIDRNRTNLRPGTPIEKYNLNPENNA